VGELDQADQSIRAGAHVLTLEDIFDLEHVSDPRMSPDGTLVAFVVTRDYTEGGHKIPASSIWLAPSDGRTPARRFTTSGHVDAHPRWSPDGRTLAFLSDRAKDDVLQLYTIPLEGGEAQRLTDVKGGVSDLAWSSDGSRLAYLAPETASEEEERRHQEKDDAVWVDHDYKFTRLWVVGAQGGEPRALTPAEYQVRGFAWFADGWAVVSSPSAKEDDFILPWTLRLVREGRPDEVLWQGQFPLQSLSASPDGRVLAWHHTGAGAGDPIDEVWVLESGGTPRRALGEFAGGTSLARVMPDGASILLVGVEGTRHAVGRLALAGGALEMLLADRTLATDSLTGEPLISISRDGRQLVYALEDGTHPAELWTGTLGAQPRQLTTFNAHLQDVTLGASESVRWQAPDGQAVEGMLIYPAGYASGTRYPLVVQVHGGPLWQWLDRFMMSWHDWGQWLAAHGYAVLMPNPRGSFGRGLEYAWSNRRAWGLGDLQDVLSGADAMIERGLADPDRLGIGGWSYGGYLTSWTIGHSNRFKAAIVGAGVTDLLSFQASDIPSWLPAEQMLAHPWDDPEIYARCSPITYAGQMATPTLIPHGEADERVPLGQGKELYAALRARQVPAEMVVYPREPHIFAERQHQRDLLERVVAWYDRWLKPKL
jgi:dipeptidyl aminopeptidase/acylaminoacyl peptidase